MATTKKKSTPEAPQQVQLRCEDLGETRGFDPAHAEALLAYQQARRLTGPGSWQPVAAEETK